MTAAAEPPQGQLRRELGLRDLVLLNIAAVVGVRWLAAAAHSGSGAFLLQLLAAGFFFVPSALAVAGLSRRFPGEGGLYLWTRETFGEFHGFLCAWFYLISNIVFFPTVLLFGVSLSSYVFGPAAVAAFSRPAVAIPLTFAALWLAFLTNLIGLNISKWFTNLGGASTYVVAIILFVLGLRLALRDGMPAPVHLLPSISFESLNLWSQIAFSFIGLELGAILGGEIRNPTRTIPQAAWISAGASVAFYIGGAWALLAILPAQAISPLAGLAQAGQAAGARLHLGWLTAPFAFLISAGILGQVGAYVTGISRLPYAIGLDRHLPAAFARLHPRFGTPYVSLLAQLAAATVFLLAMQAGETLGAAYQTLVDMSTLTGFLPFLYIFGSAFRCGHRFAGVSGFTISLAAVVLSLSPPEEIRSLWTFEAKLIGGCLVLTVLGWLIYRQGSAARRAQAA